nr:hypothetical protein [Nitrospirales bacterium]
MAVAALNGKIYVVGGFEESGLGNFLNFAITPSLEKYEPATNTWTTRSPMPIGLHHAGIGVAGGKLYVIGGYTQSGLSVWHPGATVYAYDPAMDIWTEHAPMPTPRGALSVTAHDGNCMPLAATTGRPIALPSRSTIREATPGLCERPYRP